MGSPVVHGILVPLAVALALPSSAFAQAPSGSNSPTRCRGIEQTTVSGAEPELHVVCGQAGTMLGPVDGFEIADLPALRSAVVVTTLYGSKRAWLLMQEDERLLAVEEITGTIARAMGRGPQRKIDDLDLDLGRGAAGLLTAALKQGVQRPEGSSAPVTTEIDLAALVARSRQVRGADSVTGE